MRVDLPHASPRAAPAARAGSARRKAEELWHHDGYGSRHSPPHQRRPYRGSPGKHRPPRLPLPQRRPSSETAGGGAARVRQALSDSCGGWHHRRRGGYWYPPTHCGAHVSIYDASKAVKNSAVVKVASDFCPRVSRWTGPRSYTSLTRSWSSKPRGPDQH